MNKSSGKGVAANAPKGTVAEPPCLISNTVRSWLQERSLSEAARAVVDSAKWHDTRMCWELDLTPDVADELGMTILRKLDR